MGSRCDVADLGCFAEPQSHYLIADILTLSYAVGVHYWGDLGVAAGLR